MSGDGEGQGGDCPCLGEAPALSSSRVLSEGRRSGHFVMEHSQVQTQPGFPQPTGGVQGFCEGLGFVSVCDTHGWALQCEQPVLPEQ